MKSRYVRSSAVYPAARLILPLLGLCTENEQTHPSLSHPQSSVWHQQISFKTFFESPSTDSAQRHTINLWLNCMLHTIFLSKLSYAHTHKTHPCVKTSCNLLLFSELRSNLKFEILSSALFPLCSAPPTSRYQTHQDFTRSEKNIFKSSQF